ncbi:MAG TPA: prenyltransferase/squalene oxidase repeat-containing protein [Solirubrobacterales bacterium]
MSWQLVSFLIVAAVVVAGFAWYERSRPPSQVVALVAALAALAIAGRLAFAALPNVKPLTTDVIVFAGYALGGAPGFAVGALAALVSNFWFGQGPWTPWQMAAWGLCGVLGAVLALGFRNAGRFSLAATCGLAAVLYGALMNFSVMASLGGELSLRAYAVWWLRGASFEVAHFAGNVVFALLAGPAMVRMLVRFRERFAWRRLGHPSPQEGGEGDGTREPGLRPALRGGTVAALLVAAIALGAALPARATAATPDLASATAWLRAQQNEDGGFGASPGDRSSPEITCWAMLALSAGGVNPLDVASAGKTPVDYLRSHLDQLRSAGDYARTILALEGAGVDPRDFGGSNLLSGLLNRRRKDGSYEGWPGTTAFAVIALRGAGATGSLKETLSWLRSVQNDDGGWGDVPGSPSTPDGTGAAMQALSPGSKAVHSALDYLHSHQHKGGGYALGGNGTLNTPSTAWAVQGILAAGASPAQFVKGGASARDYLAANQSSDGHFDYAQAGAQTSAEVAHQTPVWVTAQVIPAVAEATFPIAAPARAPQPSTVPQSTPSTEPSETPESSPGALPSESVPLPSLEPAPVSPSDSTNQGPGSPPGHSAKAGQGAPGAKPPSGPTGESVPEGTPAPGPTESPTSRSGTETSSSNDSTSPAGAIVLGLLAGSLLFLLGLGARRGWMRWRYGL